MLLILFLIKVTIQQVPKAISYKLRVCLFVGKLDFSFGEISKSPIKNKSLFYFGKSNSRLEPRQGVVAAFSRRLYSYITDKECTATKVLKIETAPGRHPDELFIRTETI
jgi:hypothetical protein